MRLNASRIAVGTCSGKPARFYRREALLIKANLIHILQINSPDFYVYSCKARQLWGDLCRNVIRVYISFHICHFLRIYHVIELNYLKQKRSKNYKH
jgi:hypothetical protein